MPRRLLSFLVALAGLLAVALPAAPSAAAGILPKSGIWSATAPAIDGPNAKVHTVVNFWVVKGKVQNWGGASPPLAGGVFGSVSGDSYCSAPFAYPSVSLHGNSFSGALKLDGGKVIFKGTFTSATTAHGTWEETGPCYTGVVAWTAKAGGKAPTGVNPATGAQTESGGGKCSPGPCGYNAGVVAYVNAVDRHAVGPKGQQEVYLSLHFTNERASFSFQPNSLDFALKFADGKLSGWPTGDNPVKLSNGTMVNCGTWPAPVQAPPVPRGAKSGPLNLCFAGPAAELDGRLMLQFWDPGGTIYFPLNK